MRYLVGEVSYAATIKLRLASLVPGLGLRQDAVLLGNAKRRVDIDETVDRFTPGAATGVRHPRLELGKPRANGVAPPHPHASDFYGRSPASVMQAL